MKQGNSTYAQRLNGQIFFTMLEPQTHFARKSAMSRMNDKLLSKDTLPSFYSCTLWWPALVAFVLLFLGWFFCQCPDMICVAFGMQL